MDKMLMRISEQHRKKALVHSFRQGANVILKTARAIARAKGIAKRVIKGMIVRRPKNTAASNLVVEIAFRNTGSADDKRKNSGSLTTPALAAVQEYGTPVRARNSKGSKKGKTGDKGGGSTGRILARPFMRPALDTKTDEAVKVIRNITAENVRIIEKQTASEQKISLAKKNRVL